MKKLLLLLLLPSLLLAQEDKKPRKLFFEIKQGIIFSPSHNVGYPSVGLKYQNLKGNFFSFGINNRRLVLSSSEIYLFDNGPYAYYFHTIRDRKRMAIGINKSILDYDGEYSSKAANLCIGYYYGNRIEIGSDLSFPFDIEKKRFTRQILLNPTLTIKIKLM